MLKRRTKELVEDVKETIEKPVDPPKSIRFDKVLSTGSTLLDLAIAGDKVRGGGIPGGIMMEIAGPPMCVDCDTEYLTPTGWNKISNYSSGKVLQYNLKDGTANFVKPIKYIEGPAIELFRFHNRRVDQCLSLNHNLLVKVKKTKKLEIIPFHILVDKFDSLKHGCEGYAIPTTFTPVINTSLDLTDEELRLQVAIIADGSFDRRRTTNRCGINLKKERKKKRLIDLLTKANIIYKVRNTMDGYSCFSFNAPLRIKIFDKRFFACSRRQLELIASEVLYWDGDQKRRFSTTKKESADFIQYVFASCGKRALLTKRKNNREAKSEEYGVCLSNCTYPLMKHITLKPYKSIDKKQYCFEVPSGFLVLRRNGKIFITGNSGKSALLMEIIGSCVHRGGDYRIGDPEGRLDEEYIQIYGVPLNREKYHRDKLVSEIFKTLYVWKPTPEVPDAICVYGEDSLAALSTELEMEGEDKRGQRRAKEFSEGCRKTCIKLADNNWLFVATNQIREGDGMGFKTTGGWAVPHYSSVRVSANFAYPKSKIEKIVKINNKEIKKIIGVECLCKVVKNSVSSPFREANIHIVFNVGIDDVRGNLQWLKDVLGLTKYWTPSGEFQSMEKAIIHIEQNNLEKELREATIDTWLDIESKFKIERKSKERW